jgi:hypothetical protein
MIVTVAHLRPLGVTHLLVYCHDIVCNHGATLPLTWRMTSLSNLLSLECAARGAGAAAAGVAVACLTMCGPR